MNKDLVKGITFKLDETKRVGNMRIDWYDEALQPMESHKPSNGAKNKLKN